MTLLVLFAHAIIGVLVIDHSRHLRRWFNGEQISP
jgi:hypothetical protein